MRSLLRPSSLVTEVPVLPVVAFVSVLALVLGLINVDGAAPPPPPPLRFSISATVARRLPPSYLGLSLEYPAIERYAGNPTSARLFGQLVRNLSPGQPPVLRIGGDSADAAWWPMAGVDRPPGATFTLGDGWLRTMDAVSRDLDARLILGLNLEADSSAVARAEMSALQSGLQTGSVLGFELGNEPELYSTFAWYRDATGRGVAGRASGWGFARFVPDYAQIAGALPAGTLAGPSTGGLGWMSRLDRFLAAAPRVRIVAVHRYPLQLCFTSRRSPRYPTIGHLLSDRASTGLAESFSGAIALAHARGFPLRIDELNTVSCGAAPAVSGSFASALWAVDALFALAAAGVDGVNIHTFPGAGYELFRSTQAGAWVAPEYYGLMLFAAAAPAGSRLLALSGPRETAVKVWATAARDGRLRVVAINKDRRGSRSVALRIAGASGSATVERLQAPNVSAGAGVRLGGRSIDSASGRLAGTAESSVVRPTAGTYTLTLPAASAALLTMTAGSATSGAFTNARPASGAAASGS